MGYKLKKAVVENHFSQYAEHWVQTSYEGKGYIYPTARHRTNVVCSIFSALKPSSHIVDLGCGSGQLAISLAKMGHVVKGFDQSAEMIGMADRLSAELDEETKARVRFQQAELENLLPQKFTQDAVTAMGVIGYLDDDATLFNAAWNLLKPGGLFLVSCRNRLFNMASISYRTQREIETGEAWRLLQQMTDLSDEIPKARIQEFAKNLISAGEEILKVLDLPETTVSNSANHTDDSPTIEARQHTPEDIRNEARQLGFEMIGVHGVHPHLMQPHLNKSMPEFTYNILSAALEPLHDVAASIGWSSVFIAVLRKTN